MCLHTWRNSSHQSFQWTNSLVLLIVSLIRAQSSHHYQLLTSFYWTFNEHCVPKWVKVMMALFFYFFDRPLELKAYSMSSRLSSMTYVHAYVHMYGIRYCCIYIHTTKPTTDFLHRWAAKKYNEQLLTFQLYSCFKVWPLSATGKWTPSFDSFHFWLALL